MADLETLLAPVADGGPAGADLSYDDRRQQMELAFETPASGETPASEEVDWRAVLRTIEEQSAFTKDIWLPVYMARAGAKSGNLEIVEKGCLYLAGMCATFWDSMYPSLEEYGFQGRLGPCESLTSIGGFIGPLRRLTLIEHPRHGRFSGEDIERFTANGEAADGYGIFRAAVNDVPNEQIAATLNRLNRIRDALSQVETILAEKADGAAGVDFSATYQVLDSLRQALASFAGPEAAPAQGVGPSLEAGLEQQAQGGSGAVPARIDSRDAVVRAIDAAIDYYRRREPASPVPVALSRAKAWVEMDFLSILEDIAPDSIGDARRVLTLRKNETE